MGPKPRVPLGSPGCYTQDKPYTFTPTQAHRHGSYYCGEPQSGYATKHVPQCPNKGGGRRLAAVGAYRFYSLQPRFYSPQPRFAVCTNTTNVWSGDNQSTKRERE